jgi:hypothetical protein
MTAAVIWTRTDDMTLVHYDYRDGGRAGLGLGGTRAAAWPRQNLEIGTKLMYMPAPAPVVYIVPLSHSLGRLPLQVIPAGNSSQGRLFSKGHLRPGSGCPYRNFPGENQKLSRVGNPTGS